MSAGPSSGLPVVVGRPIAKNIFSHFPCSYIATGALIAG